MRLGAKGTTLRGLILPEAGLSGKVWFQAKLGVLKVMVLSLHLQFSFMLKIEALLGRG